MMHHRQQQQQQRPDEHQQLRRSKDDLHEWSIYRQNLTSSIADSLFQPPGAMPPINTTDASAYHPHAHRHHQLPYGDFQMHETAVECVLQHGRAEDGQLGQQRANADTYLRFGLPRVNVTSTQGGIIGEFATLQKPTTTTTTTGADSSTSSSSYNRRRALQHQQKQRRRAQSEMDLRIGGGGGGTNHHHQHQLQSKTGNITDHQHQLILRQSIDCGLDRLLSLHSPATNGGHYAESEILQQQQRRGGGDTAPAFFQSKRHHAHYFSNVDLFDQSANFNYLRYAKAEAMIPDDTSKPHIRLTNVAFNYDLRSAFDVAMLRSTQFLRTIDNVTLELFGGDTLAIMYTTELEMRTLMRLLSNQLMPRGRIEGAFAINGNTVSHRQFAQRIAYVNSDDLYPTLTVKQYLYHTSLLVRPATDAFSTAHMISQLIQTLALSPFRHRLIGEIGRTEKARVKIASQILLDTDVLICDNITRGMDLYDAAFVIDYLRDWATKLNRIVIMAISPSTHEILTMFYKSAILASGRLIYFGTSHRMIDYFDSINYPTPMFKNPCDYYVDLVTHDHLTADASIESKERIRRLAEIWQQKAPPFEHVPIDSISPKIRPANIFLILFGLYRRFWQVLLNHSWEYIRELFYSLMISIVLGIIFFELPTDRQSGINDRFGLFYSLTICLFPNMLLNIERISSERHFVYPETRLRLYRRVSYLFVKIIFDLPFALLSYAVYAIPVYLLAGLQPINDQQWLIGVFYVCTLIGYSIAWRYTSWLFAFLFKSRFAAFAFFALFFGASALASGITIHIDDQTSPIRWLRTISPTHWTMQIVASNELFGNSPNRDGGGIPLSPILGRLNSSELIFQCERKRVLATKLANVPIYTIAPCAQTLGRQAYRFSGIGTLEHVSLNDYRSLFRIAMMFFGIWTSAVLLMSAIVVSCCNHRPHFRQKHRD